MKGSLDYIRFHEVWKVVLLGNFEKTDEKGNAYFKHFLVERGPEALYTLRYKIQVNDFTEVLSDTFEFYATSEVNELESLNDNSLLTYEFLNKPLLKQPIVKIIDINGNPIVGKRVIAFSWVEPDFNSFGGAKNSPSYYKMFILENFVSEPSDNKGIAKFKNLTIIGSVENIAYMHFYCEGKTTLWTARFNKNSYDAILPQRALYPVVINSTEFSVTLIDDLTRYVKEGDKIQPEFRIQVMKTTESQQRIPQADVMCFATIYESNGYILPKGYQSSINNHPVKYLERPIPGKYGEGADNPSSPDNIIEKYYLTDSSGIVSFNDLRISQSGPSGNITLSFSWVGSKSIAKHELVIQTSIDKKEIRFADKIPEQILVGEPSNSADYDLILLVEVNDQNRFGIPGKYPTKIYAQTNITSKQNNIEVEIVDFIDLFTPSQRDGVMTIPIKVVKLTEDLFVNLTLTIDGINITTPEYIEFVLSPRVDSNKITTSKFISVSKDLQGIELNEKFNVQVEVYSLLGKGVDINAFQVYFDKYFRTVGQSDLPNSFVEPVLNENVVRSGSKVTFKDWHFKRAADGHYDLRFYVFSDAEGRSITHSSSLLKVKVNFDIDIVQLIEVTAKNKEAQAYNNYRPGMMFTRNYDFEGKNEEEGYNDIDIEATYILKFIIFSYKTGLLKNKEMGVLSATFEEYPPMMQAIGGADKYFDLKATSSKTDENGIFKFEVYIKKGGQGGYVVSADFGTTISIPIPIKTKNVISQIKLESEPEFRDSSELDSNGMVYTGTKFYYNARVRITVEPGKSRAGFIVIAHPVKVSNSIISADLFPQSFVELNEDKENYLAWVTVLEQGIYAITDSSGEAVFDHLTVWDVSGSNATTKFQFAVGDRHKGLYMVTNPTERNYTYKPSIKFKMVKQPNKFASAFNLIKPFPVIKSISYIEDRPFYLLNMRLVELFNKPTIDNEIGDQTTKLISGTMWIFYPKEKSQLGIGCSFKQISKAGKMPIEHEISFNSLKWTAYGVNSYIQMSFSTYLQHYTSNAAVSQKMSLETTANSISFISDPPKSISVNEIFQVTLKVSVSGGAPLPNAIVSWNVTKAMSFSSIAEEIFSSLANSNYNIQKSSFLAPGSRLDEKRATNQADENGIAKLYIRVREAPVGSSVRLVWQSGKATTPPSPAIKMEHPIKQIKLAGSIEEKVKKTFKRDEGKFLRKIIKPNFYF